ncbi:MAG: hypothetical protein U0Q55_22810 [Vicinamibacterales bacterium]
MSDKDRPSPELDAIETTDEVGSEGGSPGDLQESHGETGTGSEAGELWVPADESTADLSEGEPVPKRRSP